MEAAGNYYCPDPRQTSQPISSARQLTLCFRRLANFDNGVFERLGRYEAATARQVVKKALSAAVGTGPDEAKRSFSRCNRGAQRLNLY